MDYDEAFFDLVQRGAARSAVPFVTHIIETVLDGQTPTSVLDVGCGPGAGWPSGDATASGRWWVSTAITSPARSWPSPQTISGRWTFASRSTWDAASIW